MRAVINISLPPQMVEIVEENVKSGGYATKSEFFRHILREWHETMLLRNLNQSRVEFKTGKAKVLKSLKDLR
jgi:Arc/MetJ-type ribon-helix-helix transcriptional regulator